MFQYRYPHRHIGRGGWVLELLWAVVAVNSALQAPTASSTEAICLTSYATRKHNLLGFLTMPLRKQNITLASGALG